LQAGHGGELAFEDAAAACFPGGGPFERCAGGFDVVGQVGLELSDCGE
jgi:hypothetical protein